MPCCDAGAEFTICTASTSSPTASMLSCTAALPVLFAPPPPGVG
jgi:hypothetical protein